MKVPIKATLSYRIHATDDSTTHKYWTLTTYCRMFSYLLETYATDDVIAEAEGEIMYYKQPENMSAIR